MVGLGWWPVGLVLGLVTVFFHLVFVSLLGYGCPKHTMFPYIFNKTSIFHLVFPFNLCCVVSEYFFESACDSLRLTRVTFGLFCWPWAPLWPPCWPFWCNSSTISAFSTFHNFADFHEFLKTHHIS